MSLPREAKLAELVGEWQANLKLTHWEVRAALVSPREGRMADIQIDHYRRHAMIRVNDDEEEARWPWIIVHELLHIVVWPLSQTLRLAISRTPAGEREVLEKAHFEAEEPMIDHLVRLFVTDPEPFHPNLRKHWHLIDGGNKASQAESEEMAR